MSDQKKLKPEEDPKVKMYRFKLDLEFESESIDGARKKALDWLIARAKDADSKKIVEGNLSRVVRKKHSSRADRLSEAKSMIEDARAIVDELKGEIEEWRDNLPENLQGSDKYSSLDECASNLESVDSSLDEAESSCDSIEFPGMFD